MKIEKVNVLCMMISSLIIVFFINPSLRVYSQGPTKAEILQAQNYFTERNLLPQLVSLTKDDSEQATRFSDVILACYHIFQEFDNLQSNQQNSERNYRRIKTSLDNLNDKIETLDKQYHNIVEKITESIIQKAEAGELGGSGGTNIREEIKSLEQKMLIIKTDEQKNQQNIKNTKKISIVSLIFTGLVAILAAL